MSGRQDPFDGRTLSPVELELFSVARITKTRGLRGEVKAEILTDYPERFADLNEVYLQRPTGELLTLPLEHHWFQQQRLILKFIGYDTIEQAQSLVGCVVMVGEEELVELESDEFFHFQLVDCDVMTIGGSQVGRVSKVLETGGTPLLIVEDRQGREHLIPFAQSICPEVDIVTKQIRIDPPDGLLDL